MALAYKCHSELSGKFLSSSHRTHRAMPYFLSFHVGMGSMSMNDSAMVGSGGSHAPYINVRT